VTEFGAKAEYDSLISRFKNLLSMPLYCVPGNHDVAWAPIENFVSKLGDPNWYFEYGGCWFIGINPYPCGFFGRCLITDGFYNYWDSVISNIPANAPVFIFRHNTGGDAYYTNENKELKLWKKKNTVAIFCGHGHGYATGTVENITWIEADGAVDNSAGNYTIVDVDTTTKKMTLYQKTPGQNAVLWKTIDFSVSLNAPQITITSPQENQTITSTSFNLSVTLDKDASSGVYSIDGGTEYSLTGSGKNWSATVTTPSSNGQHCLKVKMTMPDGRVFSEVVYFFSERSSYPKAVWRKVLSQPVMSSIVVKYGLVYLGCYDGKVYCYDLYSGNQLWSFSSLGNKAVHSSPEVVDGVVYIGSGDNRVYAIDAFNGSKIWEAVTDDAVVAGPVVYSNYVFVGNINNKFYGINRSNGSILWTYNVGDIISAKALVYNGNIYFGCWDRYIYSLTTSGSLRWKKNPAEVTIKNYAPAVSQPYGYGGNIVWVNRKQWVDIYKEDGTEVLRDYRRCYDNIGGSGDRFYIRSLDGDMRCFLMDGTTVWVGGTNVFSYDSSRSCVVEDGGVLYTGSVYGKIAAVNKDNGSIIWSYQAVSGEGNPPRGFMESTVGVQRGIVVSCGVKGILSAVTNSEVTPPDEITFLHTPPTSVYPDTQVDIDIVSTSTDDIVCAVLYYKGPSENSYNRSLMKINGKYINGVIPEYHDNSGIISYYFVLASSFNYKISDVYTIHISSFKPDMIAPAKIEDLSVSVGPMPGSVILTWTSPGDDGKTGDLVNGIYRIDYSDTEKEWKYYDYKIEIVTTTAASVPQSLLIQNLSPSVTYYFRIWTSDELRNWSEVSNGATIYACPLPAKPQVVFPENNTLFISTQNIMFMWVNTGNIQTTYIQISKNLQFTNIVASSSVNTNSFVYTFLDNGTYYWRLQNEDIYGFYSGWTEPYKIMINVSTVEVITPQVVEIQYLTPEEINYLLTNKVYIANKILVVEPTITVSTVSVLVKLTYADNTTSGWQQVGMKLQEENYVAEISFDKEIKNIEYFVKITMSNNVTVQTEPKEIVYQRSKQELITSAGGKIILYDSNYADPETYLEIPQNAISQQVNISFSQAELSLPLPANTLPGVVYGPVVGVSVSGLPDKVNLPLKCSVVYSEGKLNGYDEQKLKMFFYDGTRWQYVDSRCFSNQNVVEGKITKNGYYGLFIVDTSLIDKKIFKPQRVVSTKSKAVFSGINVFPDVEIKIYDVKGRKIRTLKNTDEWDLKDDKGRDVSSGVYIYKYTISGEIYHGTISVIK
jgi:outer membrane protein assembly factor BamB